MRLGGKNVEVDGRLVRIGRLAAEGFEFVEDPEAMLADIVKIRSGMDLFTFIQRLPATTPEYNYPMEWDNVAAIPVSTFEHWWTRQIDGKTRNMVQRSEKKGLVFREVAFDDALVRGIWEIYNECPVRQGRPFPHYGKDIEAVGQMSGTFLDSSVFIGAFFGEKLVGFVKLTVNEARSQAAVMHIIALMEHRDKAPMNALIAESVKACEKRAIPYLVYSKFAYWKKQRDTLSDFKERNGFRRFDVPRYYVPLTRYGGFAFHLGLQHGVLGTVPEPVAAALRRFRDMWYEALTTTQELKVFTKETIVKGQPAKMECVEIGGQVYTITKGPVTVIRLEDEWFEDVADPAAVIETLKESADFKPDIFTFWQRLPDIEPKHSFRIEWEEIAVLPIKSYDHWWNHQIKSRIRNQIRKAEKEGLVVKEAAYDDDFVRGMTAIFNEAPVRQGRKFWHYGKDFQTVKRQFSRYIHREDMIGAYYQNELIGFIMMGNAGRYGVTGQIISAIKHRDKSTNNALIAKAVELCEKKKLPYLVYLFWSGDSLTEFKRRCGFEKTIIPRYFVPLTQKGTLALKLGFHRGWKGLFPKQLKASLIKLRRRWYGLSGGE